MTTTTERLARVVAFQEGIARRSAQRVVPTPGGFAVLDDRYPASYEHNQLYLTGRATASVVAAHADRLLRRRRHRYVTALDPAVARRLTPGLLAAGYGEEGTVVMVLEGAPEHAAAGGPAERVPLEALRDADARAWDERYPQLPPEVVRQLFERRFTTAGACDLSTHVVRADGAIVAWCNLYRVGREAQVESVNTLPPWRRRGFARAVVLDAVAAAAQARCELVFLLADRDDWPRDFYERLGFAVVAEQRSFVRIPA